MRYGESGLTGRNGPDRRALTAQRVVLQIETRRKVMRVTFYESGHFLRPFNASDDSIDRRWVFPPEPKLVIR
jgi:hypothetical protein